MADDVVIDLAGLDLVFGQKPARGFAALDAGAPRAELLEAGHVPAVRDVSLRVHQGELLVVMGASGSGKSSLLRCMNGLVGRAEGPGAARGGAHVTRADGSIVDVMRCAAAVLRELRARELGMVFAQPALLPWRTVAENTALPLEVQGVASRARAARVAAVLEKVGLRGWEQRLPHELSSGMQQRVGLARALVGAPPVLLLDEPFSALDPLLRRALQDELLALRGTTTTVFVTHDVDEAMRLGTRIAVMHEGALVQLATPAELVLRPAPLVAALLSARAA